MLRKTSTIKSLFTDEFARSSSIFFFSSVAAAFLNYLYHPILGRLMDVADFGEAQAAISLFLQFGVLASVFSFFTISLTSNAEAGKSREASFVIAEFRKFAVLAILALAVGLVLFHQSVKEFLNFSSIYPLLILMLLLLANVLFSFRRAYLQGVRKIKSVSAADLIFSASRLFFAVAFVYAGWRSSGAVAGLLVGQLIALAYVFSKTKDVLASENWSLLPRWRNPAFRREFKFGLLVLVSVFCVTFFYASDIIFVRHYFPAEEAGLYGGIATVARIIFFATSPIVMVMLPMVKLKNIPEKNEALFRKAFITVAVLGLAITLVLQIFPALVIKILIGGRYAVFAPILPRLGWMLFAASLANLLSAYFIALRKYALIPISLASVFLTAVLAFFFHSDPLQIINGFICGLVLIIFLSSIIYAQKDFYRNTGL
ncbi:MAG: oligosaccharide flippase family protein [Candidatus Moranbacteria bacterium]|nr:oligosaccharide flippase family protein [bacterium]MDP1833919.1 oligosaccharide flippase family protein [Candidatus Moranbacteria bacterium]MDZ4385408.1 oligosaccharide flippase family protein [Candidatus Moranbacteria bacterium]